MLEKINEQDVAKVNYLNGKWKKKLLIWIGVLSLVIFSGVAIWGWGFQGFLYLEMKKRTNDYYLNLIVNQTKDYQVDGSIEVQEIIQTVQADINDLYKVENHFIFLNLFNIETLKSSSKTIYAVSQQATFVDHRQILDENKISPTTFFIYQINNKQLVDLLFWNKDLTRLEGYK